MIRSIRFVSLDQARKMAPSLDAVMVSILDLEERLSHRLPRLAGYRSVLSLTFEDTAEEKKLAEPGSWSDEPTEDEHSRFAQRRGEKIPTLSDARKIFEFVTAHHGSPQLLDLVVHCKAGISRSAAVAMWAQEFTGAPMSEAVKMNTHHANPRLMRLLDKASAPSPTSAKKMRP